MQIKEQVKGQVKGQIKGYVSKEPIVVREALIAAEFTRADLKIMNVDHSGATYEGRIFFNNAKANAKTPKTVAQGYAGSFYVFGHGGCFGDVGHCDVPKQRRPHDLRQPHPLTPRNMTVPVTDALRKQLKKGLDVHISIVPIIMATNDKCDAANALQFSGCEILTYK